MYFDGVLIYIWRTEKKVLTRILQLKQLFIVWIYMEVVVNLYYEVQALSVEWFENLYFSQLGISILVYTKFLFPFIILRSVHQKANSSNSNRQNCFRFSSFAVYLKMWARYIYVWYGNVVCLSFFLHANLV